MSSTDPSKRTNSLACERCRAQKLRCDWPAAGGPNPSCERCSRKGVQCRKNHSRRVGRPPRSRAGRAGSASFHLVDPRGISFIPPALWQEPCDRRGSWEENHTGLTPIDPAMMASGLESPPLSGVLAHDGELMNFFASDLATDWMPWSSDGPNSVNSVSEQSSSGESLESSSDNSEPPPKEPEPPIEDQQCDPPPPPKSSFNAALTCEVASLTSCLFELVSSNPVQKAETSPGGAKGRSTATLRNILQHTQTLSNLVTKHDRTGSGTAPLALDGPTKLLLLSCYAKIFQAFRQIFAAVYSGLQSGENIAELLYDLRVEDVILDGDDDLKILVLMQVVTHKLNTLGVQLGVPEKHYISVGSGGLDAPKQTQPRGRQLSSEETEPTLDAILSGSETDRCVFWGEFKDNDRAMESAAAAFREELGLLRGQLGHRNRCGALTILS